MFQGSIVALITPFKNNEVDYFHRDIVFEIISSITNKK